MTNASYKDCSKCTPFARTHARSRERHWLIVSSMTLCLRLSHTLIKRCFRSSTSRISPDKHGPASYPTPCSQQGWGRRGCWEATDWEQWKPEPLAAVTRPSYGPYGPVHCPAGKWRSRQKLHGYGAASPVSAAPPDNMLHLFWCQGPRIWGGFSPTSTHRTDTMTDFVKVVRVRNNQPAAMFLFFDVAGA